MPNENDGIESQTDRESQSANAETTDETEEQAPTPFDHPFFLPVLLTGLMFWFGYDGFLNDDPEMAEHITFNQVGFVVLLVLTIYFGIQGYKEWKEDQPS